MCALQTNVFKIWAEVSDVRNTIIDHCVSKAIGKTSGRYINYIL